MFFCHISVLILVIIYKSKCLTNLFLIQFQITVKSIHQPISHSQIYNLRNCKLVDGSCGIYLGKNIKSDKLANDHFFKQLCNRWGRRDLKFKPQSSRPIGIPRSINSVTRLLIAKNHLEQRNGRTIDVESMLSFSVGVCTII